jgi:cyclase
MDQMKKEFTREMAERPPDYLGPNLNPRGLILQPHALREGVYALMANQFPKDNNGVIVGEKCALVIDAGINGAISRQIQDLVRHLTDQPLRYLANTTYHGDHTFGNATFPESVTIVSSRQNRESMHDLAYEKRMRFGNLREDAQAFADVTTWRLPDVVFERFCAIDLGNRLVELWHLGPGNAPGDTIVSVPDANVAWTGNFLMSAGIPPMLLEGGPGPYLHTLQAVQAQLSLETIVPGHGPMGQGQAALENFIAYMQHLQESVGKAFAAGLSLEATLAASPVPALLHAPAGVLPTPALQAFIEQLHRLNVLATYRAFEESH